jgi:AcrR family transcriptional regulator
VTGTGDAPEGLRERKKRATRAALAEAAIRLAARHGAENVTVEAISAEAGVSARTFFNYFDSRDDAFLTVDADFGPRVRRLVLDAPAALPPLRAVREALAAELADVTRRRELWELRAKVFQQSPHLLARGIGAHQAEELELAAAIAERVGQRSGTAGGEEPGLYPRLLAGVAMTAVRVSIEWWSAGGASDPFLDIFAQVFDHLAAGLPAPR